MAQHTVVIEIPDPAPLSEAQTANEVEAEVMALGYRVVEYHFERMLEEPCEDDGRSNEQDDPGEAAEEAAKREAAIPSVSEVERQVASAMDGAYATDEEALRAAQEVVRDVARSITVEQAEARILADNACPFRVAGHEDFMELRRTCEDLQDAIQRAAEKHGVADPGAVTPVALLLELQAAVDAYAHDHPED